MFGIEEARRDTVHFANVPFMLFLTKLQQLASTTTIQLAHSDIQDIILFKTQRMVQLACGNFF